MKYSDPLRPKISGRPAYTAAQGRPIAALPLLSIEPGTESFWTLSMWLLVAPAEAKLFQTLFTEDRIGDMLRAWKEDPERAMEEWFGYRGPTSPRVAQSLEDLGL